MINKNEVLNWANERGLLKPENKLMQMGKMVSEVGELCDAIIKDDKNGQIDGIGDVLVTLIILANQLGYDVEDCLEVAYTEIKNRKGETINGTFIKE
jgi:NTP pyrophosphatase (non-canonical NTP hydrolase)